MEPTSRRKDTAEQGEGFKIVVLWVLLWMGQEYKPNIPMAVGTGFAGVENS